MIHRTPYGLVLSCTRKTCRIQGCNKLVAVKRYEYPNAACKFQYKYSEFCEDHKKNGFLALHSNNTYNARQWIYNREYRERKRDSELEKSDMLFYESVGDWSPADELPDPDETW